MDITNCKIKSEKPVKARIAVAADIHGRETDDILCALSKLKPDIIAVPGDLVGSSEETDASAAFLKEASNIAPTYFSIGNHERKSCFDREAAERSGAQILDDRFCVAGGFVIGGLSSGFLKTGQSNFKKTPPPETEWLDGFCAQEGYRILLSHHPEYYGVYLKDRPVDLIISGHAHGGQWRFFGIGIFAPGQGLFPKYTSGIYDGRLVVSRGLSNHTPVPRIFNRTELLNVEINI